MPNDGSLNLPGQKGQDYHFVKYGGKIYVVYAITLPGGQTVRLSYGIRPNEYKGYGIEPGNVQSIPKAAFQGLQFLGNASEIILRGDQHPWVQYLHQIEQANGNVSWMHNKEFLSTMLQGFFEGWDSSTLQQNLTQTKWYQNRTATQRQWATMGDADKKAAIKGMQTQLEDQLRTLYGPDVTLQDAGITPKQLDKMASSIVRGDFGTVDEGVQRWLIKQRNQAEQVKGTQAWIDRQQQIEQQNAFMNRPEDVFQQLKTQAQAYLGPQGMLDNSTLQKWSKDLVAATSSQADWEQYLQKQAQSLYPWLNPGETWQDRASSYKNIVEQNLGAPINWDDKLLANLGGTDANGVPNGSALSFDAFTQKVRNDGRFWTSNTAKQETYGLFNRLNATFNGQGVG